MAEPDFDVVIVGAGPAGSCAAIEAARGGLRTLLLERGPFPGSKNMYGGVVYPRILDDLIPEWWTDVPIQRWVTRRSTMVDPTSIVGWPITRSLPGRHCCATRRSPVCSASRRDGHATQSRESAPTGPTAMSRPRW